MEWLKAILNGVEGGDRLYSQITAGIGQEFVSKADFNTVNEEKKLLKGQLETRDKDIETLKKQAGSNEELQKQYDDLQKKYTQDTESLNSKISAVKKETAVDLAIVQAKGRNPKAIKALLDLDGIKLKDDGTLEGLDFGKLQASDPYLFDIETKGIVGTGHHTSSLPSANNDYETRLIEARKSGNTLEAIKIKQEASSNGVILN